MSRRPLLLDLFCGAGGAAMGYHRAGFDVIGVDIAPQPDYPFTFMQDDAFAVPVEGFDAIHTSPPCQAHTSLRVMWNASDHPDLIAVTREHVRASGLPYVIENVPGAPLLDPVKLCGSSFGLGVEVHDGWRQLRRHRLFESNVPIVALPCAHSGATIGIYGDHARDRRRKERDGVRVQASIDFPDCDKIQLAKAAMGMDWPTRWPSLSQAIPPAYTECIGAQLLAHIEQEARRVA